MKKIKNLFPVCCFAIGFGMVLLSHGAWAKDAVNPVADPVSEWSFGADLYIWGAGVGGETSQGNDIDVSFGDVLDTMDFGFMGVGHVFHDKWHASLDVLYMNLSDENGKDVTLPNDRTLSGHADIDLTSWVLTPLVGYVALETERFQLEPFAGARYLNLDTSLDIRINDRTRNFSNADGVWDGIVGARGDVYLDEHWHLPYYADIGTGDTDL